MTSRDFGPAHPSFWMGKWRDMPYAPTFENYTPDEYSYQHPYWANNYFYTPKRPARWGSLKNYRGPFLWSRYGSPWNYS